MPSAWEALTSALCLSRAATFARSCFSAASANEVPACAHAEPLASNSTTSPAAIRGFALKQLIHLPPAIAKRVEPHAHLVEQRQVQVGQRRWFGEADVPAALHPAGGTAGDKDRQIVVVVPVGVTHTAAVQQQRMVQERTAAFARVPQFREELREQRDVEAIDPGHLLDLLGVVAVMREGV